MRRGQFFYSLPESLIAQFPSRKRDGSRLLLVSAHPDELLDLQFTELPGLLRPGDLLVFNDTRVLPARLLAEKESGGKVELLLERALDERRLLAQVRASKPPRPGMFLRLERGCELVFEECRDDLWVLAVVNGGSVPKILERIGRTPLPPYIRRRDDEHDKARYQTVYAKTPGAVAAPTAGLHFTDALLHTIAERGVDTAFVTLHIGAGTFRPVRADNIEDHRMHHEYVRVPPAVCAAVKRAREKGGRVVAVGTSSVRALETAAVGGGLAPYRGETDIFIHPGYRFKIVDALITNFHAPESTLLMLVTAFAGRQRVMDAYQHAVEQSYRFFSYGDAMFVERAATAK